jgi:hypothetical protein
MTMPIVMSIISVTDGFGDCHSMMAIMKGCPLCPESSSVALTNYGFATLQLTELISCVRREESEPASLPKRMEEV